MGTRNLTCVVQNGKYKVAQYGQWDGYPGGQGHTCLEFLTKRYQPEVFAKHINNAEFLTQEESAKINDEYAELGEDFWKKYPNLDRDTAAKILDYVQENEYPKLVDKISFAGDSLFCEWCYVIDLDKQTFEVYQGFNEEPLQDNERFKFLENNPEKYYPVKHVLTVPFSEINMNSLNSLRGDE